MLDIASGSVHDIWVSNSGTDVLDASIGVFFGLFFFSFHYRHDTLATHLTGRFKRLYTAIYLGIHGTETETHRDYSFHSIHQT